MAQELCGYVGAAMRVAHTSRVLRGYCLRQYDAQGGLGPLFCDRYR